MHAISGLRNTKSLLKPEKLLIFINFLTQVFLQRKLHKIAFYSISIAHGPQAVFINELELD